MSQNDEEVKKQIQHMMAFIDQEAREKAEEIEAKAEEEFQIEKGRLVQQQRLKIMEYYERKEKNLELQKKIQQSNMLNQARLRVLKCREDHVMAILDEARLRLGEVIQDRNKYAQILKGLLGQGLYQLMEKKVTVRCKECDLALVKEQTKAALADYKKAANRDCEVKFDEENFLGADITGGIEMYTANNKIKVTNTLESRLDLMSRQMLPEVRKIMFGVNVNRKFED
ncbi:V-type proton ATPase subunit E-like [Patiria miniata]|uniref:Vacuolar ATP synthase subunit E n=1 Tax=Patiria miniata TaxID=46514 RepID=A0A913ZCU0_PATMI|nr:V-type proton ATPase subunit E-like [Patiria miniata]